FFFFQAEDGIRDKLVTGVQTCALPILAARRQPRPHLLGREPRLQQPLADHVRQPRVLLYGLLQGGLGLGGGGDLGQGGRGSAERSEERRVGKECGRGRGRGGGRIRRAR